MRINDALDIRIGGQSALRAVLNGEIVWEPTVSTGLTFPQLTFPTGVELWSWGANTWGQLGVGNTTTQTTPVQLTNSDWTAAFMARSDIYGIRSGILHSCGANFGNQGNGGNSPASISPLVFNWYYAWGSDDDSYSTRTDGTLWARGGANLIAGPNYGGTFVQIGSDTNWDWGDAGRGHHIILKTNDTIWTIGDNSFGRTGLGTTSGKTNTVTQVGTDTDWAWVGCGHYHSFGIKTNGTLWSWGNNGNGRTGLGTAAGNTLSPTQVGSATNWIQVAGGLTHSLGVRADGTLWSWGQNSNFKTAQGTSSGNTLVPTQIGTDTNWAWAWCSYEASAAIKTDGTLWTWGSNANGATAQGTTTGTTNTPTQVGSDTDWVRVYGAGDGNFCALKG